MTPRRSDLVLIAALLVLLSTLSVASVIAGRVWTPLDALGGASDPRWLIVTQLRIPRTVLAIAVGAVLGLAGATLQGYTRNPLADPGVLGVSSMAALGAVLTIFFSLAVASPWVLPVFAMGGSGLGVVLLVLVAAPAGEAVSFLLAGVILNTIASAGVALALSLAPNPWASSEITTWLMGSLADRSPLDLRLSLPFMACGAAVLLATGPALDALTLGETGARALGVSLRRTQAMIAIGVGLACGAAVAVTGVIGFVGLITPHLIRRLVGSQPSRLLVPSALAGAALLLAADILVRLTPGAQEVHVGVAMAGLGAPFFLALLLSMRRSLA
ncbi:MAG: transport system permease protein [Caulobacteraceae bacterium]|nr:transport system permease protein [Caulobacteraceae bacterium]